MRKLATTLLAVLVVLSTGHGSPLKEQLALATTDEDTHAQIELIRRILEKESDDTLSERLIRLWLSVADYDMAESSLKAWKNAPEGFQASVKAEILYNRDEKRDEAIALLAGYHAKDPSSIEITRQLARYYGALGEHQKIVALLSSAPGVSADAALLLQRASARRALADYEGALKDFYQAEKADGEAVAGERPAYDRIKVALPKIQFATAALEKDPGDYSAHVGRAWWLLSIGASNDFISKDAAAAHSLAPQSAAALLLYARASYSPRQALQEFSVDLSKPTPPLESMGRLIKLDQLITKNPRDVAALAARSFELNGIPAQHQLALKDAEAALAVEPASAGARLEKIFALIKLDRAPEAASEVLVMEGTKPPPAKLARSYGYLAEADLRAYRLESALDYASKALKAEPTAEGYKMRAAILQRLGQVSEAQADLAKAQKLARRP